MILEHWSSGGHEFEPHYMFVFTNLLSACVSPEKAAMRRAIRSLAQVSCHDIHS